MFEGFEFLFILFPVKFDVMIFTIKHIPRTQEVALLPIKSNRNNLEMNTYIPGATFLIEFHSGRRQKLLKGENKSLLSVITRFLPIIFVIISSVYVLFIFIKN